VNGAFVSFLERHGLKMGWSCRRNFLIWLLAPPLTLALLVLVLLSLNPQTNKYVYIFQSMVTSRNGDEGPEPPTNYTGVWYRWHWNGKLSFEEHYKDGKLDGPFRAWNSSGQKWLETAYRAGLCFGDYVEFYDSGSTNRINHYFDERPAGLWTHFYADGKKREERYFSEPGIPDGKETVWNTNGMVTFSHTWHKGLPWDGLFTLRKGTNWFRDQYESGRLISSTYLGPVALSQARWQSRP
jgi:MORN repeat variant